jgi:hypothetical protein
MFLKRHQNRTMHLPTYLTLMAVVGLYGLAGLVANFFINKLLFAASIFVLLITAWGTLAQVASSEDWEIKWMLWYIVPAALLLFGSTLAWQESQNQILSLAGAEAIPSLIPGRASDYSTAAKQHFISMIFPFVAKAIATLVGHFVDGD